MVISEKDFERFLIDFEEFKLYIQSELLPIKADWCSETCACLAQHIGRVTPNMVSAGSIPPWLRLKITIG